MIKKFRAWFRKYLEDLLIVIGFGLIAVGSYHIHPIVVWFVGGIECLVAGFLLAWSKRK